MKSCQRRRMIRTEHYPPSQNTVRLRNLNISKTLTCHLFCRWDIYGTTASLSRSQTRPANMASTMLGLCSFDETLRDKRCIASRSCCWCGTGPRDICRRYRHFQYLLPRLDILGNQHLRCASYTPTDNPSTTEPQIP